MTDALAFVPRWLSMFRDDPVLFVALVSVSGFAGWWMRALKDKGTIGGLREQVKVKDAEVKMKDSHISFVAQQLKFAEDKIRDYVNERLQLQTEIDRLKSQIERRVPSLEVVETIGSVQSSLGRLDAANNDISLAIRNSTAEIGGTIERHDTPFALRVSTLKPST